MRNILIQSKQIFNRLLMQKIISNYLITKAKKIKSDNFTIKKKNKRK